MNNWWKTIFLIGFSGALYYSLEVLYRGHSHWSMFLLGGICCSLIDYLYRKKKNVYTVLQFMLMGGILITALEGITGAVINVFLHEAVWNYSNLPFHFLGQVCLFFSLLWCVLTIPVIYMTGLVRCYVFHDENNRIRKFRSVIFRRNMIA